VFESTFRALFKYERLVFEQGQFVLTATRSMWLVAAVVAGVAVYVLWTYLRVSSLAPRDRAILMALRVALLAVAVFVILRPALLLKVAVPQQNFVAVVVDDSRSMRVADQNGRPRTGFVLDQLGRADAPLLAAIGRRFVPRVFRFSTAAERLQNAGDLTFEGTGTRFGAALDRVREEMSGLPVAGVIVVSDGADNAEDTLDQSIAGLKSQGLPVFTVGVGQERLTYDVQITRAETPARVLQGAALVVDVVVTQSGYAGAKVPIVVEEDGKVVGTQTVTLPPDGESRTVKVRFKATDTGPRVFRFRVPVQDREEVAQNNQRDSLITVYGGQQRVLYFEGQPRPEPKFIRQATDEDPNLRVVLLQRTAEATASAPDKYYRQGVEGPEDLQNGFPTTREELFRYPAVILGSIEAGAFTPDQQRMLEDFVDVRGGSVLMLGGLRSFSEGGWAGTPLSDALPVALDRAIPKPIDPPLELVVRPTRAGQAHPAVQIGDTEADTASKWDELPALTAVNDVPVSALKPGGIALLTGGGARTGERVVLAYQRYGRGKTLVLPVQDTWLWRFDASMGVEDRTHHNFWQRLTRWLVDGAPDRVSVTASPGQVQRGDPVAVTADVFDPEYKGVTDGRVTAHVIAPSGRAQDVPLAMSLDAPGQYTGTFTPAEDGLYDVAVGGTNREGADVGRGAASVRVAPSEAEYFDAAMRAPLLTRLAEDTGGRFFRASDIAGLVDAISYSGRGVTVVEERELWDMPILLILLLGLMGGEWWYRRSRGLA
jgi:uncharacterized membrane protein